MRIPLIATHQVTVSAMRAQGAGGQNVNKVSSAIHLRFDIKKSELPDALKQRLLAWPDRRISRDGVIIIKAQAHRTQTLNREAALARLNDLVASAAIELPTRVPTRPSRAARQRRVDAKIRHAQIKVARARVEP